MHVSARQAHMNPESIFTVATFSKTYLVYDVEYGAVYTYASFRQALIHSGSDA